MPQNALNAVPQVRVSLGSAIVLGLMDGKLDAAPTTAYLMTYRAGKCTANCGFCPQARSSKSSAEMLSRVTWPIFPTEKMVLALKGAVESEKIKRVCIQALNYPSVFTDLQVLVKLIKSRSSVAVSVSCQPKNQQDIQLLADAGVNRVGIALDGASEAVFRKVKGSDAGGCYQWENQFLRLNQALEVFGKGNVSTHVIVGLGETEREAVSMLQRCVDLTVLPALFAFTPVRGTPLENSPPPTLAHYRRVQLARHLIGNRKTRLEDMRFDDDGKIVDFGVSKEVLDQTIISGLPFRTSGCPDCNRPFYNEKASGPFYNYACAPTKQETEKIRKDLGY